ncbi:hypothetical protein FQA39_LY11945 [Lamprigera yunnana]|nr:hypothetical protein FQA39_LY11945 [Lamprigera yunnana]
MRKGPPSGSMQQLLYCLVLLLGVVLGQKNKDEDRPYEFSFKIDSEQHRYEKKDVNGIIQGEFGFITADGVYHVTVYATDENGNFKIISMKNIKVSEPLDQPNPKTLIPPSVYQNFPGTTTTAYGVSTNQKLISSYQSRSTTPQDYQKQLSTTTARTHKIADYQPNKKAATPHSVYQNFSGTTTAYRVSTNQKLISSYQSKSTTPQDYQKQLSTTTARTHQIADYQPNKKVVISPSVYQNFPSTTTAHQASKDKKIILSYQPSGTTTRYYQKQLSTSARTSQFVDFTTASTVRIGCGGCGIITTSRTPKSSIVATSSKSNSKPEVYKNPIFKNSFDSNPQPIAINFNKPNVGSSQILPQVESKNISSISQSAVSRKEDINNNNDIISRYSGSTKKSLAYLDHQKPTNFENNLPTDNKLPIISQIESNNDTTLNKENHGEISRYSASTTKPVTYDESYTPVVFDKNRQPITIGLNKPAENKLTILPQLKSINDISLNKGNQDEISRYSASTTKPVTYDKSYTPVVFDKNPQPITIGLNKPAENKSTILPQMKSINDITLNKGNQDEISRYSASTTKPVTYDENYSPIIIDKKPQPITIGLNKPAENKSTILPQMKYSASTTKPVTYDESYTPEVLDKNPQPITIGLNKPAENKSTILPQMKSINDITLNKGNQDEISRYSASTTKPVTYDENYSPIIIDKKPQPITIGLNKPAENKLTILPQMKSINDINLNKGNQDQISGYSASTAKPVTYDESYTPEVLDKNPQPITIGLNKPAENKSTILPQMKSINDITLNKGNQDEISRYSASTTKPVTYDENYSPIIFDKKPQPITIGLNKPAENKSTILPQMKSINNINLNKGNQDEISRYSASTTKPVTYDKNYTPVIFDKKPQPITIGLNKPAENKLTILPQMKSINDINLNKGNQDQISGYSASTAKPVTYDESYTPVVFDKNPQPITIGLNKPAENKLAILPQLKSKTDIILNKENLDLISGYSTIKILPQTEVKSYTPNIQSTKKQIVNDDHDIISKYSASTLKPVIFDDIVKSNDNAISTYSISKATITKDFTDTPNDYKVAKHNLDKSKAVVENGVIRVPGNEPIVIQDKYPNMIEGLPTGITKEDISDLLYKFNYTVGFHGHYEKGWKNGTKVGGYFVNGRDGYSRVVTYVADEFGYHSKFKLIRLGLDSLGTPKEETEKSFGLEHFEFVWYPLK